VLIEAGHGGRILGQVAALIVARSGHAHDLRSADGRKVGTLVARSGCAWGLGPALRSGKAREGDHLVLLCDPARHEARVRIGDETVLHQVARPHAK
jgi:hypothetical protein